MDIKANIQTFIGCDASYQDAKAVIFGAPMDQTTSFRPGTRFGPAAIRSESFGIETYSPYQDRDLEDYSIVDMGDLELVMGNVEGSLDMIYKCSKQILSDKKIPLMIGGEHLVTLPQFKAVLERYPDVVIVHLDAHADLRTDYLGQELSHACVMRRCFDLVGKNRIYQFGIRSGERNEFALEGIYREKFTTKTFEQIAQKLAGKPVYFTLDLDVLDPSIFAGTGTPEAGGISFTELVDVITKLDRLNVVGMDVNELAPHYDASGVSTAVACKVVRELLLATIK